MPAIVRVSDVMSPTIKMISRMATVADAIETMREAGVSSLLVDRRDPDDEYGLVVITDIAREVIARNRPPERVNVYEIMSKPVITVSPDMQVRYAVRMLVQLSLSRALVLDAARQPLGLVTLRDLLLRHPRVTA